MAIEYLAWELPLLVERIRRIERRELRDAQNPFALPREEFISCFRLTPEVAMYIIDAIRADLRRERTTGLKAEIKVLIAIQFYAQGSFQRSVGMRMLDEIVDHIINLY